MPQGNVIFNKKGKFFWFDDENKIPALIRSEKEQEWFIAELYYPPEFDYDTSMHDKQIQYFLSKPEELKRYEPK
ncbi:TPA: hypothetical protein QHW57_004922 [Escherichia coli]|uniref:hypothetical protein n=1 Tax=Enterobacteriaceae TaxID=543 RepID=UPI0021BF1D15|nr:MULTISPECIES: hypothetical protein [Enterobacteriaceae]MCT9817978.1 hypothetical protein [Escherichia coli]MDM3136955.1 hypothetical protein [Citrobacter sp. Cf123]HDS6762420.1 hypothetical protein [Escherichia coli]